MKDTGQPSRGAGARGKVPQKKPASLPQEQPKKKHPGGRPSKLTPELAVKIFTLARKGLTDQEIGDVFDITRQTICNWKQSPEFFDTLKESKDGADAIVERSLCERASGFVGPDGKYYPPDPTSCIFWLKNRQPTKWREKIDSIDNLADSVTSVLQLMRKHEENKTRSGI